MTELADLVAATLSSSGKQQFLDHILLEDLAFDTAIIDEAAQTTEPSTLIPLRCALFFLLLSSSLPSLFLFFLILVALLVLLLLLLLLLIFAVVIVLNNSIIEAPF